MSSILTNNGAMVALQTLNSINQNLAKTQSSISTGKRVASARDDSAVWAISKVMDSDVKGFKGISDSLNLGQSTVAVARQAAEAVTDLLVEVKAKIVSAQEENVDRTKIQADINALRDQITGVVNAAQFNGLNLLKNVDTIAGTGSINILASLDRTGTMVTATDITVGKQDLGTGVSVAGTVSANAGSGTSTASAATGLLATLQANTAGGITAGDTFKLQITGATSLGMSGAVHYVARDGETLADVVAGFIDALNQQAAADAINVTFSAGSNAGEINFTNGTGAAINIAAVDVQQSALDGTQADGTIGGRMAALNDLDVTTQNGTDIALTDIEKLMQVAIDSAASFGSAQGRIDTQVDFVSNLIDAMKSGIGTLIDENMEEASARLQALQVQQQLAMQSLSIANQAPQALLSLFQG